MSVTNVGESSDVENKQAEVRSPFELEYYLLMLDPTGCREEVLVTESRRGGIAEISRHKLS